MQNVDRVLVGKLGIDSITMEDAVQFVASRLRTRGHDATIIETVNAQFVCLGQALQRFVDFVHKADLVVADGMSVVGASRVLRKPLPERIAGVDLVVRMCEEAARLGNSVYFLGGRPGTAEETSRRLIARFPRLKVAGIDCPPWGFEKEVFLDTQSLERVKTAAPDILFVALGAPKQEFWMESHLAELPVKVMIGVGGTFEMLAGVVLRAPKWMQRIGLEWVFRLVQDPRRLWRRYVFGNAYFLLIVAMQWLAQAFHVRRTPAATSTFKDGAEAPASNRAA